MLSNDQKHRDSVTTRIEDVFFFLILTILDFYRWLEEMVPAVKSDEHYLEIIEPVCRELCNYILEPVSEPV